MMTIDEAIVREKRIHEENKKVVDTHVLHEEFTLEELYCDDTEVIEEYLNNYKFASEYHKQLAEWLEELKEMWKNQGAVSDFWYLEGYNKALNELAEKISVYGTFDYHGNTIDVFEIAEQMKME